MWRKCTILNVKPSGTCTRLSNGLLAITYLPIKAESKNMKSKVTGRLAKFRSRHFQNANPNIIRTRLFTCQAHLGQGQTRPAASKLHFSVRLASLCSPVISRCQQILSLVTFILMLIPCILIKQCLFVY
jgi:hypothetical protein